MEGGKLVLRTSKTGVSGSTDSAADSQIMKNGLSSRIPMNAHSKEELRAGLILPPFPSDPHTVSEFMSSAHLRRDEVHKQDKNR